MALVLVMAGALWGVGWAMGAPRRLRWGMIGFLWAAVVLLHLLLPPGHPLRMATGESAALWLILGGFVALVLVYASVLRRLRRAVARRRARQPRHPRAGGCSARRSWSAMRAISFCGSWAGLGRRP